MQIDVREVTIESKVRGGSWHRIDSEAAVNDVPLGGRRAVAWSNRAVVAWHVVAWDVIANRAVLYQIAVISDRSGARSRKENVNDFVSLRCGRCVCNNEPHVLSRRAWGPSCGARRIEVAIAGQRTTVGRMDVQPLR